MFDKEELILISNLMQNAIIDYTSYLRNINFEKYDKATKFVLFQLNTTCIQYSQTVMQLILDESLWESEILLRTIFEGSIKLAYLASEPEQFEKKIFEFCYVLPYLNSTKCNNRVDNLLNKSHLSDDDYQRLKKLFEKQKNIIEENKNYKVSYDKKERNNIKRKWGFLAMLETIEKCNFNELSNPTCLSFPYGMMSNIVHMDYDGLQYIYERIGRSNEDLDKVNTKQICRQYLDIYYLFLLRTLSICIIYDTKYDELKNFISIKHKTLLTLLDKKFNEI